MSSIATNMEQLSRLLSLPPELRLVIYDYLVNPDIRVRVEHDIDTHSLGITAGDKQKFLASVFFLPTCRIIYTEARSFIRHRLTYIFFPARRISYDGFMPLENFTALSDIKKTVFWAGAEVFTVRPLSTQIPCLEALTVRLDYGSAMTEIHLLIDMMPKRFEEIDLVLDAFKIIKCGGKITMQVRDDRECYKRGNYGKIKDLLKATEVNKYPRY